MGDVVFNQMLGRLAYYATLPAANDEITVLLLTSTGIEADATIRDYDDLGTLLGGTNTEADFTNYVRKAAASVTVTVDDTNNWVDVDMADITWTSAGGGTNNTIAALLTAYDNDNTSGTDSNIVPATKHDFSVTTDGSDLTAQVASAGFYRAA